MRFGKIYVLGETGDYDAFAKELKETIAYSSTINNKWLWLKGKPLDDAEAFFLSNVQSYQSTLYDTQDDDLMEYVHDISNEVLKYYPANVPAMSNIAVYYMIRKEYAKALPYLKKAETINPNDAIVLGNIAYVYKSTGKKEEAIGYYNKMIKAGNEDDKAFAAEMIKELQSK